MSDQHWQPPAPPASAGYGPPPLPPGAAVPQGGWTPPPRPGLLPLRPMGFGTLLWAPFRTLRRNPAPVFGTGLIVQLASAIASAAVFVPFLVIATGRIESADARDLDAIVTGTFGWLALVSLVPIAIGVVAGAFLQGVMVVEVASGTLGEKLGFGALWRRAAGRIGPLIGWTLLVGAVVLAVFVLLAALVVATAVIAPDPLTVLVVVLAVLFLLVGLAVLGAWLGTKLALVPSIIVLERAGIVQSVRRSWRLTDGHFWRTFGLILLVGLIVSTIAQTVVQVPVLGGALLAVILDPAGGATAEAVTIASTVVGTVLSVLIGAIVAVVQAALIAVIYIDLRMRSEGLDLELQRTVEAREAGQTAADPFLPAPAGEPAPTWS